jgi:hypothetical protein
MPTRSMARDRAAGLKVYDDREVRAPTGGRHAGVLTALAIANRTCLGRECSGRETRERKDWLVSVRHAHPIKVC